MAFKIPIPLKCMKPNSIPMVPNKFGLPHFNRCDLKDCVLIGMGSFGKVFRGYVGGELAVMKEMANSSSSGHERHLFEKEVSLLKQVSGHDNIVNISAYTNDAILLSYAEFSFKPFDVPHDPVFNLKELLHACNDLSDFVGFQHLQKFLCVDMITGLQFLHSKGIAHRDLKPDNVLVCNRHYSSSSVSDISSMWSTKPIVAKLTDFGESRSAMTATKSVLCTRTAELYRGSPAYMSPEAFLKTIPEAAISDLMVMDIWSLGMTVFMLLNPDIAYPFATEINRQTALSSAEALQKLIASQVLPAMSEKYTSMRNLYWQPLEAVYQACVQFNPASRPVARKLLNLINVECSPKGQNSAFKEIDMQAFNQTEDTSKTYQSSVLSVGNDTSIASSSSQSFIDGDEESPDLYSTVDCLSDEDTCNKSDHFGQLSRYTNNELHISLWDDCVTENVSSLPFDLDGLCKFKIPCKREDMMIVTKDGRPWSRWSQSSRKYFMGVRRIARCKGSYVCEAEYCPFLKLHSGANRVQFRSENSVVVCFSCGSVAKAVACSASKVWEFEQDCVTIMHKGIHTCRPKVKKLSRQHIVKAVMNNPNVKPSKLVNDEMVKIMTTEDFSWNELEKVAESFTDLKRIHNVRTEVKNLENPLGQNFEALALFKQKCDEKDKFLIYKVNSRALNGEPSFIFKSSLAMAKLALSMDKDTDGAMAFEYAFVDAKHDRCRGFKTITLWAYHGVSRKLVCLAIMEAEQENTESLIQFWNLVNAMLQSVSGCKEYQFNPFGFVADENHANWKSIQTVFGSKSLERVVSCEFHYKQSVERHARKLGVESTKFVSVAYKMLEALSIQQFESTSAEMRNITQKNSQLQGWFKWWHDRRSHIFKAFKVPDAPASNLAEVGHSKMQSVGRCYMNILEAAREDVASAIRQEADLRSFESGLSKGGRGPNYGQRKVQAFRAGMKWAAAYAAELDNVQISGERPDVFVPKAGKHRPPDRLTLANKMHSKKASLSLLPGPSSGAPKNTRKPTPVQQAKSAAHNKGYQRSSICLSTVRHRFKPRQRVPIRQHSQSVNAQQLAFHLVLFGSVQNLKTCYGCKKIFAAKYKKPPNDLILKFYCHRKFIDIQGVESVARNLSGAYFHLNLNCTRKIVPQMEVENITVHCEVKKMLTADQKQILAKFGVMV